MELTRQQEKELRKVVDTYWNSYIKGDLKTIASLLDENYTQVGSAETEVFFNKKEALKFLRRTIKEVAGKVALRNRITSVESLNDTVLVSDLCDLYVLDKKKWIFYARFRASSLLTLKKGTWKIFHQHSSFPDTKTAEGGNLSIENVAAENQQLRDAVKRHTVELVNKNRELEIETALEKVRAIALGMKKPEDMLGVCHTIAVQLKKLGVKEIRNVQTAIFYESKGTYMNYEFYAKHNKEIITETSYTNHKVHRDFANQMLKGKGETYSTHITKKRLKGWIDYQKTTNVFIDKFLRTASSLTYYWHSLGPVALGISTYVRLTREELDLFERFINVFELAYTRYLDIEQAHLQAREAQIQLALERVRARTMAMQHSEELSETVAVLFEQFNALGTAPERMAIEIVNEKENVFEIWATEHGGTQLNLLLKVPLNEPHVMQKMYKAWQSKTSSITIDLQGKELEEYFQFLKKAGLPVQRKIFGKRRVQNVATFSKGILTIITPGPRPKETIDILERFASVFDGTYTRFLDLQRSEEQAKEARIEASLERIRAAAMSMHRSEQLINVCEAMYAELKGLGFENIRNAQISIRNLDDQSYFVAEFSDYVKLAVKEAPFESSPLLKDIYAAMERSKDAFYQKEFAGKVFSDWRKWRTNIDAPQDPRIETAKSMWFYLCSIGKGYIGISTFGSIPDDQIQILKRFRNVFELSYRRYLDVAQAEAQAKESQVQLALERVRARTMAMQKPSEFVDVITVIGEQFVDLGFDLEWVNFGANGLDISEGIDTWNFAVIPGGAPISSRLLIPRFDHPLFTAAKEMLEIYQGTGNDFFEIAFDKEEKDRWLDHLFAKTLFNEVPEEYRSIQYAKPGYTTSNIALKDTFLSIGKFDTRSFTDEQHAILRRFANAFGQAYTRFLDLQQAEEQARESRIEAALEKVRSRSLAMHNSDELQEVVDTVFDKLMELQVEMDSCNIAIFKEESRDFEYWISSPFQKRATVFQIPYLELSLTGNIVTDRESGAEFSTRTYSFEEKNNWFEYAFKNTDFGFLEDSRKKFILESPCLTVSIAFAKYTGLQINSYSSRSPSTTEIEIIKRFSKVFEQAYIRFRDLQRSETQAKEARIEAALEKVRSRSLAMHRSEELQEVVTTVLERLQDLDIQTDAINLDVFNENRKDAYLWTAVPGHQYSKEIHIPYNEVTIFKDIYDGMIGGQEIHSKVYSREQKDEFLNYVFEHTDFRHIPKERKEMLFAAEGSTVSVAYAKNTAIIAQRYRKAAFSDDENETLKRFAKVFEQAYTRFLDLQKAEAQSRESQVELGLERVRARAMAMQTSDELKGLIGTVFTELTKLDLVLTRCVIMIYTDRDNDSKWWMANSEDPDNPAGFYIKPHDHAPNVAYFKAWKARELKYIYLLEGKIKQEWDSFLFSESDLKDLPPYVIEGMKAPDKVYLNSSFNNFGNLTLASLEPLSDEHFDILLRFAKVFDLTYTRFNDLQRAEAQAREAQVEAALERVRARTMAMHSSDDVISAIITLFTELERLGIENMRCGIAIVEANRTMDVWSVSNLVDGKAVKATGAFKMDAHKLWQLFYDTWKSRSRFLHYYLSGKEKQDYIAILNNAPGYLSQPLHEMPDMNFQSYHFDEGAIWTFSLQPHNVEDQQMMHRFTAVFSQTFRRYQDLQKAEAQAKEAQIEAALERVRAKAMAMHQSEDFNDAVAVVFEELKKLDIGVLRCGISVLDKEKRTGNVWVTSISDKGSAVQVSGDESFDIHPLLKGAFEAWLMQEDFYYLLEGDDLKNYYNAVKETNIQLPESQVIASGIEFKQQYCFTAVYQAGGLFAFCESEFPEEAKRVIKRFAGVFDLTYKRFVDLQKAEAQAKESQVQLALERIRARTMAMQHSDELADASVVLFQQFAALGQTPDRISIGIINEEDDTSDVWATDQQGTQVNIRFKARNNERTTIAQMVKDWKAGKKATTIDLQGDDLKDWIIYLRTELGMSINDSYFHGRRLHHVSFFSQGWLNITTLEPLPAETLRLLDRFAAVFNLTYTRFVDLKKAEAQAREAKIEAALERVRAKVIGMNHSHELQDISYVFGDQMRQLGVDWQFSYFWLIEEQNDANTFWITWPDNHTSVTSYSLAEADPYTQQCLVVWKRGDKIHSNHLQQGDVKHWLDTFQQITTDAGDLAKTVMQEDNFKNGVYYYDAMMKYGSFGLCMNRPATEEESKIQCRFAIEFERAYTRFLDLKQAEYLARQAEADLVQLKIEKQRTEEALNELQATQKQLIQSEKMASLGELTAGIAHEIQNPLNFVNNFSEVSNELLDEMIEEIKKGNHEEVEALVNDVKQNLEKINHHGKRADGIVKGMLQHSRTSSGQKELTDINALADEYLRLSYHGLRAKDKTFNAKFETDFDNSIDKINIIPQDIGRVILNLITNAFYVVNEKKKQQPAGFEPTVTLITKKEADKIEIRVKDNGNGIPKQVLDKIFQPFFTTKPTGQGTGLGLSLSYDIVKAHGGELKVETVEGTGSVFIMQLPLI